MSVFASVLILEAHESPVCNHLGDALLCLTTVSLADHTVRDSILIPADVEHAVEDHGKQLRAGVAPVLQYEGFEPSPYEKNDARADGETQLVRRDTQTCGTVHDLVSRSKPTQCHLNNQSSSSEGSSTRSPLLSFHSSLVRTCSPWG
jgi:hypothetical protein